MSFRNSPEKELFQYLKNWGQESALKGPRWRPPAPLIKEAHELVCTASAKEEKKLTGFFIRIFFVTWMTELPNIYKNMQNLTFEFRRWPQIPNVSRILQPPLPPFLVVEQGLVFLIQSCKERQVSSFLVKGALLLEVPITHFTIVSVSRIGDFSNSYSVVLPLLSAQI